MVKKIKITETIIRDGQQSLIATRMTTDEILPIISLLDKVGYHSIEAWGGATYDSCLRFLNEDPWERLRKIKNKAKNTPLQMLFRGQNALGYRHYSDDVIEYFVQRCVANGVNILRIFDALNDVRNLKTAVLATKKENAHVQAAISYTTSPVHNIEYFINLTKEFEEIGADSICIKDMSGLLKPDIAYDLITEIKKITKLPIQIHSHCTSGYAPITYWKAIEAGSDVVDCALSPFSLGTSQPSTETIVAALKDSKYDTDLDINILSEISDYFQKLRKKYIKSGLLDTNLFGIDINMLKYQVPGGMISNLNSQLKEQSKEDKLQEVFEEIPKIREDLGFIPLVTPTSQIVGNQAVLNIITGERYKIVTKEIKEIVRGRYGKTPIKIKNPIVKKIIGDNEIISCRPADLLKAELDSFKHEIKEFIEQEEDVLSYALFGQVAKKFFEFRRAQKYKIDKDLVNMEDQTHPI
ncbi:MAG: oxaloacetate decarboxylase subunit alpha [Clostridiales bacterium]|jgi:oxaloacetate decarboxylase alpha subunit|nr:oxaloacetate decarboxylase subunit alpha [Clostridiales bacterium]